MSNLIAAIKANTLAVEANTKAVAQSTATDQQLIGHFSILSLQIDELNANLATLLQELRHLPDPGSISLSVTQENGSMLQFKITLPTLPEDPGDIVSGLLKVTVGDGPEQSIETEKTQTEVTGLSGEQGQAVNASFAWVDDAGNLSAHPSTLENVILADNIAPPDPGALGLAVTAEV